jgi:hypothetical protein
MIHHNPVVYLLHMRDGASTKDVLADLGVAENLPEDLSTP